MHLILEAVYGDEDATVEAALAILAKRMGQRGSVLSSPQAVRDYLRLTLADLPYEVFWAVFLDAQNRVIAAEELFRGDPDAIRNLTEYRGEIERAAIEGSQAAALVLAKMYDRGIGVHRDQGTMLAWLQWGQQYCATEDGYAEELQAVQEFYEALLPCAQKLRAKHMIASMLLQKKEMRPTLKRARS